MHNHWPETAFSSAPNRVERMPLPSWLHAAQKRCTVAPFSQIAAGYELRLFHSLPPKSSGVPYQLLCRCGDTTKGQSLWIHMTHYCSSVIFTSALSLGFIFKFGFMIYFNLISSILSHKSICNWLCVETRSINKLPSPFLFRNSPINLSWHEFVVR